MFTKNIYICRYFFVLLITYFVISCRDDDSTSRFNDILENEPNNLTPTLTSNILSSNGTTDLTLFTNATIRNSETIFITDKSGLVSLSTNSCSIISDETNCSISITASEVTKISTGILTFSSSEADSSFTPSSVTYTIEPISHSVSLTPSLSSTSLHSGEMANIMITASKVLTADTTITATGYNSDLYVQKLGYLYFSNGNDCTITVGENECSIPITAAVVFEETDWSVNLSTLSPIASLTTSSLDYTVGASTDLTLSAHLSPNPLASGESGQLTIQTSKSHLLDISIDVTADSNLTLSAATCTIEANNSGCIIEVKAQTVTETETGTVSFTDNLYTVSDVSYDIDPQTFDGLVRGWPNYLAMGNITDAVIYNGTEVSSTQSSLQQYPMNAIFKYAGTGQPKDQNSAVTYPYETYQTLAQTSWLTVDYADNSALPDNSPTVKPVMVVYTANASYDWYSPVGDFTDGVMMNYFSKLILIAQLLEKKGMGSIILNPDLLGKLEQGYGSDIDNYALINAQLAANGSYTVQASLAAAVSFATSYQSFSYSDCDGLEDKAVTPIDLFNALIETCYPNNYLYAAYEDWNSIMTTAGPDINSTRGAENYPVPDLTDNDVIAWIKATNWIMHTFAPNISYGWQENLWASGTSSWIYSATADSIDTIVTKDSAYLDDWDVFNGAYQPDFIVFDRYEGDDFMPVTYEAGYLYNASEWNNYITYVGKMSNAIDQPAMIWQIPGAHIQRSNDIDNDPTRVAAQHGGTAPNYFFSADQGGTSAIDYDNLIAYIDDNDFNITRGGYDITVSMPEYLQTQPDGSTDTVYYWDEEHLEMTAQYNIFSILWGGGTQATGAIDIQLNTEFYDNGWLGTRISSYFANPEYFITDD